MPKLIYTADKGFSVLLRAACIGGVAAVIFTVSILVEGPAMAMDGPWSISGSSPVFESRPLPRKAGEAEDKTSFNPFVALVKGFQKVISPVDGDRCSMYPTCSAYSIAAFRKHGTMKGLVLTADRLLHEPDEHRFAPVIIKHGMYRYYDPVERNDFWWY